MALRVTNLIIFFLMVTFSTATSNYISNSDSLEDRNTPMEVIFPLTGANIPGFQEGSIYTGSTLASGLRHTCVVLDNGSVSCWGANHQGQLGNGNYTDLDSPILTSSFGNGRTAVAISSGQTHMCAILDNGSVSCWGNNYYGQLGDGSNMIRNTPTQTLSLGNGTTAVAISSGPSHTCAVLDSGSVSCWGGNGYGQLGDGTRNERNTPAPTLSLGDERTAVAVSTGMDHTCVILDNGSVSCWGRNNDGQLGDGGTNIERWTPAPTLSLGSGMAVAISSGSSHTCVLIDNGSVSCWGGGGVGHLGNGDSEDRNTPTQVDIHEWVQYGRFAVAISSGTWHTCALLDDGSISCWGGNSNGQLGDGTNTKRYTPTQTSSLGTGINAVAISSGDHHTCAILSDDSVSCWGDNFYGQLGDGDYEDRNTPTTTNSLGADRTPAVSERDFDDNGVLNIFEAAPPSNAECEAGQYGIYVCVDSPVGKYVPTDLEKYATDADIGYYVDETGQTTQMACPGGMTTENRSASSINECIGLDSDGDGVEDNQDAFPNDINESIDTDEDGVGDNSDAFPNEANESIDSDEDGVGDNSDAFPNDANESIDSDGDGVGDNSDAYPGDPLKWENESLDETTDNASDNQTEPTNEADGNDSANSTTVTSDFYYECLEDDYDCDGISNSGDNDADADGLMDDIVDSNSESTNTKWLHDFIIVKTSDGFELHIEYRMPLYPNYGSHVSYVMAYDENGSEREMPLIWDVSTDGTFKMGVPSTHLDELERSMCSNPTGSPTDGIFDMHEWINNSVKVNQIALVPEEIDCSWKNQPSEANLDKITSEIQSETFITRMHKEYELVKYTVKFKVADNSTNLEILPIYAVNDSSLLPGTMKAFHVDDRVNGTTSVWYWWSQSYSSEFDLQSAEIGSVGSSSSSSSSSSMIFIIAIVLGVLIVRRRKKKKLKKAMKKMAKQHMANEKAVKKQAKIDKKNAKKTNMEDTNSLLVPIDSVPSETVSTQPVTIPTSPEVDAPKPIEPSVNLSQISPTGPIQMDSNGYEWSTDQFQRSIYRVAGSTEHWNLYDP